MKPDNPQNQGKWRGFAKLGYPVKNTTRGREIAARSVIRQLRKNLPYTPALKGKNNVYGIRFKVVVTIKGFNSQTGDLTTIWQIDKDSAVPRLITNWVQVNN